MRRVPQLKWAAMHDDVLGRPFFSQNQKQSWIALSQSWLARSGASTACGDSRAYAASESQADSISFDPLTSLAPKIFLLAGHLNQTLALWPMGG